MRRRLINALQRDGFFGILGNTRHGSVAQHPRQQQQWVDPFRDHVEHLSSRSVDPSIANRTAAEVHKADCQRVAKVGATLNISLCVTKLALGSTGMSQAVLADGIHAMVDVTADAISYMAVTIGRYPVAPHAFPFGVGRVETLAALMVAVMLLLSGGAVLVGSATALLKSVQPPEGDDKQDADHGLTHSHSHSGCSSGCGSHGHSHFNAVEIDEHGKTQILWFMAAVTGVSVGLKQLMYRYAMRVGTRAASPVVVANAYHHRADSYTSGLALVGVVGASLGMPAIDAVAGVAVGFNVLMTSVNVFKTSASELFDHQAAPALQVRRAIEPNAIEGCAIVNSFVTRHGPVWSIHSTVVVDRYQPLNAVDQARQAVHDSLTDAVTKTSEESCENDKEGPTGGCGGHHSRGSGYLAGETFLRPLLVDTNSESSLREALAMVQSFHGIGVVELDAECKLLFVKHCDSTIDGSSGQSVVSKLRTCVDTTPGGSEQVSDACVADVKAIAKLFGYRVVSCG